MKSRSLLLLALFALSSVEASANNNVVTLFQSASRTAGTYNTNDQYNFGWKGIQVNLRVTTKAGTSNLNCKMQAKDMVASVYYDLPNASFAQVSSSSSMNSLTIYPGVVTSSHNYANMVLPLTYRFECVVAGSAMTFSAAGQLQE